MDAFDGVYPVTSDGSLLILPTPGHTYHHTSVLLRNQSEGISYLFAGDAIYSQDQMISGEQAGAHADYSLSAATRRAIKEYARRNPTIILPSHDGLAGDRLATRDVLSL